MITIPLRSRQGVLRAVALVDDEDVKQAAFRWSLNGGGYVHRKADGRWVLLHRAVLGLVPGDGYEADHINGDVLDCRRANLRRCTRAENGQNVAKRSGLTSRYRGVSWCGRTQRWVAQVADGPTTHFLGRYRDEKEAAEAAASYRARHMSHANSDRYALR